MMDMHMQQGDVYCDDWVPSPSHEELVTANVNPQTGLATDFLNLFNEYIMLAELVHDGSMEQDVLSDWLPIDYETHFARSGFAGARTVLDAFRSLQCARRRAFEAAVEQLIDLILVHQEQDDPCPDLFARIRQQRDVVAGLIHETPAEAEDVAATQSAIDDLFD
ncbi:MAG TPA: hypothetical protein ENJ68_01290 [Devosia sp.]|nr:hypothetical protein [Devosia sp.]